MANIGINLYAAAIKIGRVLLITTFFELNKILSVSPINLPAYSISTSTSLFKIFSAEQVEKFCSIFFDKDREEGNLHPVLDEVVDKWIALDDDEQREDFRLKVASYVRLYSYLSQIINFSDVELEKHYIFYRYLSKKLKPKTLTELAALYLVQLQLFLHVEKV